MLVVSSGVIEVTGNASTNRNPNFLVNYWARRAYVEEGREGDGMR